MTDSPVPSALPPAAVIFDLDGVVVDTARFHYQAWKQMADREGIHFDEVINERLKGVSRMDSLDIIMERAPRPYSQEERVRLAAEKNAAYCQMLKTLTPADILPGAREFIEDLRRRGIRTAISSASKNTDTILEHLGIGDLFDVVVTGNDITRSKPDPQGMLVAAERLSIPPAACVVIEDAYAGIEAARRAGMRNIGIGSTPTLC